MRWRWLSSVRKRFCDLKAMICPKCKVEYREGFAKCSDCDVALVDKLDPSKQTAASKHDRPALAWRGDDPVVFSAVLAALGDEEIPNYEMSDHEQLPFEPANPRPQYAIFVRQEDVSRAKKAIQEVIGGDAGQ
jgi:hypothetical protein